MKPAEEVPKWSKRRGAGDGSRSKEKRETGREGVSEGSVLPRYKTLLSPVTYIHPK